MNKNIGDMTRSELIDYIIELQEINSRYERKTERLCNALNEVIENNSRAIEYIKSNEKEYGSLEDNEKIILDILKGDINI